MKAAITTANRTTSGKLIDYILTLEDGSQIRLNSSEIKEKMLSGEMEVTGMKLDATGRLVKAGKDSSKARPSRSKKETLQDGQPAAEHPAAEQPAAQKSGAGQDAEEMPVTGREDPETDLPGTGSSGGESAKSERPKAFVKVRIV